MGISKLWSHGLTQSQWARWSLPPSTVNKVSWNTVIVIHLHIVHGCFHVQWQNCVAATKIVRPEESKNLLSDSLQNKATKSFLEKWCVIQEVFWCCSTSRKTISSLELNQEVRFPANKNKIKTLALAREA